MAVLRLNIKERLATLATVVERVEGVVKENDCALKEGEFNNEGREFFIYGEVEDLVKVQFELRKRELPVGHIVDCYCW